MHNNFTIGREAPPKKMYFTVVEAAVALARSEGARNAGDPRIQEYTRKLLAALENGELKSVSLKENASTSSFLTATLSADELRVWVEKNVSKLRPKFLY